MGTTRQNVYAPADKKGAGGGKKQTGIVKPTRRRRKNTRSNRRSKGNGSASGKGTAQLSEAPERQRATAGTNRKDAYRGGWGRKCPSTGRQKGPVISGRSGLGKEMAKEHSIGVTQGLRPPCAGWGVGAKTFLRRPLAPEPEGPKFAKKKISEKPGK